MNFLDRFPLEAAELKAEIQQLRIRIEARNDALISPPDKEDRENDDEHRFKSMLRKLTKQVKTPRPQ